MKKPRDHRFSEVPGSRILGSRGYKRGYGAVINPNLAPRTNALTP
jgi:hypothetical protein